jgi:hypothetical protein
VGEKADAREGGSDGSGRPRSEGPASHVESKWVATAQLYADIVQNVQISPTPTRAVSTKAFPLPGSFVGVAIENVTEETLARRPLADEQKLFEMIVEGAGPPETLAALAVAVERQAPPTIARARHRRLAACTGGARCSCMSPCRIAARSSP